MDYISTDFGADSSSRFPFRARTNRQTDATERHIMAADQKPHNI